MKLKRKNFMKKFLGVLVGLLMIFGAVGNAAALSFDLGSESTVTGAALTDPGLKMSYEINRQLDNISYDLEEGQTSDRFLFATFWTTERWVNPDDLSSQAIYANVDFDSPENLIGEVGGTSVGTASGWWGFRQGWKISWNDPVQISYGNGGLFELYLSDASFKKGFWFGPDGSYCNGAEVYGTIKYIQAPESSSGDVPAPAPEPATVMLFGIGLLGVAGVIRGKK
jgi:hypothetical protein